MALSNLTTAQGSRLPDHAIRGPLALPGPTTGFYQTISFTQNSLGASETDTLMTIIRVPYDFVLSHLSWFATGTTGTGVSFNVSHHSLAQVSGSTDIISADIDLDANESGYVDANTTPTLQNRDFARDRYLILRGTTGGAEAITDLNVVITGWCDAHPEFAIKE